MPSFKKLEAMRQKLKLLQDKRRNALRVFDKNVELISGSYGETYIRCGKPGCHCQEAKKGHFATRLARWVEGKLKSQIVKVADRSWVKEASSNYKEHKAALLKIQKLSSKEQDIVKKIINLKTIHYK